MGLGGLYGLDSLDGFDDFDDLDGLGQGWRSLGQVWLLPALGDQASGLSELHISQS